MLYVKKYVNRFEFDDEFGGESGFSYKALEILYDFYSDLSANDIAISFDELRDEVRFSIREETTNEIVDNYISYNDDTYKKENTLDELNDLVRDYLEQNTFVIGSYNEEGEDIFIYFEF